MADTTPERLHHYTSLSSLAYILDSRKIRFTRLDQLDDVLEAQKVERFNFGEVLYASSWVANAEEAYPQWSMYGDAMRGVRVSLPYYPFDCHNYIPVEGDLANETVVPMPMDEAIGEDFKIVPFLSKEDICRPVTYVADVAEAWRKSIWIDGDRLVCDDPRALASYKSNRWEFQKEHRFVLQVHGRLRSNDKSLVAGMLSPNFIYFDVPISDEAFRRMEVTMGPLRSPADLLIADALLKKYAPEARLSESSLLGEIRPKMSR